MNDHVECDVCHGVYNRDEVRIMSNGVVLCHAPQGDQRSCYVGSYYEENCHTMGNHVCGEGSKL